MTSKAWRGWPSSQEYRVCEGSLIMVKEALSVDLSLKIIDTRGERDWRNMAANNNQCSNVQNTNKYDCRWSKTSVATAPDCTYASQFWRAWWQSQIEVTEVEFLIWNKTRDSISSHHTYFMAAWRPAKWHLPPSSISADVVSLRLHCRGWHVFPQKGTPTETLAPVAEISAAGGHICHAEDQPLLFIFTSAVWR